MDDLEFDSAEVSFESASPGRDAMRTAERGTDSFDGAAFALAALGHPVRFEMIRLLGQAGETGMGSGEIARRLGAPRSTASMHLAILREAGLVRPDPSRAAGRYGHYRHNPRRLERLAKILTRLGASLPGN